MQAMNHLTSLVRALFLPWVRSPAVYSRSEHTTIDICLGHLWQEELETQLAVF